MEAAKRERLMHKATKPLPVGREQRIEALRAEWVETYVERQRLSRVMHQIGPSEELSWRFALQVEISRRVERDLRRLLNAD
jgi:hypothetical protein